MKLITLDINTAILQSNRWFNSNLLLLNPEKLTSFTSYPKILMQQTYTYHMKIDKSPVYRAQHFSGCCLIII